MQRTLFGLIIVFLLGAGVPTTAQTLDVGSNPVLPSAGHGPNPDGFGLPTGSPFRLNTPFPKLVYQAASRAPEAEAPGRLSWLMTGWNPGKELVNGVHRRAAFPTGRNRPQRSRRARSRALRIGFMM